MTLSHLPLSVSPHQSLWHEDPPAACGAVTSRGCQLLAPPHSRDGVTFLSSAYWWQTKQLFYSFQSWQAWL